jgi:hypothetical protein
MSYDAYDIKNQSIWPILVSKELAGHQQFHQKIKCWLKNCFKLTKNLKAHLEKISFTNFENPFVYFFYEKAGKEVGI